MANGIPDYQINGGWRDFIITGSTTTLINQQNKKYGEKYLVGTYSHTTDGVSQCSKNTVCCVSVSGSQKTAYPYAYMTDTLRYAKDNFFHEQKNVFCRKLNPTYFQKLLNIFFVNLKH